MHEQIDHFKKRSLLQFLGLFASFNIEGEKRLMPKYVAFGYMPYERVGGFDEIITGRKYQRVEFESPDHESAKTKMDELGLAGLEGPNGLKRRLFVEVE